MLPGDLHQRRVEELQREPFACSKYSLISNSFNSKESASAKLAQVGGVRMWL
jgi:hypothetical protein